jgi:hypothetical protein
MSKTLKKARGECQAFTPLMLMGGLGENDSYLFISMLLWLTLFHAPDISINQVIILTHLLSLKWYIFPDYASYHEKQFNSQQMQVGCHRI